MGAKGVRITAMKEQGWRGGEGTGGGGEGDGWRGGDGGLPCHFWLFLVGYLWWDA